MIENKKEYSRLPGRGFKRGISSLLIRTRARLYAGKDHLLSIYSTGYTEDYRRFYYKDIQAVVACKTARGKIWNIIFGIFTLVFSLLSFTVDNPWTTVLWIITGFFLLFLFINWFRGPTCMSHLYTAVTKEELPSLSRLKNTIKVMNHLRLIIENTQGKLTHEEIRLNASEIQSRGAAGVRYAAGHTAFSQPLKYYDGKFHEILFYLLLIGGLYTILEFFFNYLMLTILGVLVGAALAIFGIVSVIKQHNSSMKGGLIGAAWSALGYIFVDYIISYFVYIFIAFKNPNVMNNQWELLKIYSEVSPFDSPFLMGFYIFSIVGYFLIGITGLILLKKFRQKNQSQVKF
jgi:hypothetical protein